MRFLAVRGKGDPNEEGGEYQAAVNMLYAVAFTIKMSRAGSRRIDGYFDYVVPPLEGLWWQEGTEAVDYARKADFQWLSLIRLPDFVRDEDFDWALAAAAGKKGGDFSKVELFAYDEGLCVQCMHVGSYDAEPETIAAMDAFASAQGYETDLGGGRFHHEIYLGDPRRCAVERLRTVVRHPLRKRAGAADR